MSDLTFGLVGLADVDLTQINAADESSDSLSFRCRAVLEDAAEVQTVAAQLCGYPNPDEPVILVQFTGRMEQHSAWYDVKSVRVSRDTGNEAANLLDFDVSLVKIDGRSAPRVEHRYVGWIADNSLGIADGYQSSWWAIPSGWLERHGPAFGGTWGTRSVEDGTVDYWYDSRTDTNRDAFSQTLYSAHAPADYYVGSAGVYAALGGGTDLHRVTGRNMPNTPTAWRLNNGAVSCGPSTNSAASLELKWWGGSAFESTYDIVLEGQTCGILDDLTVVSAVRVSPELSIVRTAWIAHDVEAMGRLTVDLHLRRGSRIVGGVLKCDTDDEWGLSVVQTGNGNNTTVGMTRGSNDADGNRWSLFSTQTMTKTGANREMHMSTTGGVFRFGVGCEIGGSGASAPDDYETEGLAFLAVNAETQRVRGR